MIKSFLPNKKILDIQSQKMALRFEKSLKLILNYARSFCDSTLIDSIEKKIISIIQANKTSSFLYAVNLEMIKAIKEGNDAGLKLWLEYIANSNIESGYYNLIILSDLKDELKKQLLLNVNAINKADLEREFQDFSSLSIVDLKNNIDSAIQLIKVVDENTYYEIKIFLKEIFISKSRPPIQGSSTDIFGAMYFNCEVIGSNIIDAFERIIHESAHLYLYTIYFDDNLLNNDHSAKYFHALRTDKRPLISVYHACFVLARIVFLLSKLLALTEEKKVILSFHDQVHAEALLVKYKKDLRISLANLDKHADYTKQGKLLIDSIEKTLLN